jgi:hypothetical protein
VEQFCSAATNTFSLDSADSTFVHKAADIVATDCHSDIVNPIRVNPNAILTHFKHSCR